MSEPVVGIEYAVQSIQEMESSEPLTHLDWIDEFCRKPRENSQTPKTSMYVQYRDAYVVIMARFHRIPEHKHLPYHSREALQEFAYAEVFLFHPDRNAGYSGIVGKDKVYSSADLPETLEMLYQQVMTSCTHENSEKTGSYNMLHSYYCKDCGVTWSLDSSD